MKSCINGVNFIRLLRLATKLFKFNSKNVIKFYVHIYPVFSCRVTKKSVHSCDVHKHKQYRQSAVSQVLSSQVTNEFGTSNDTAIQLTFTYSDYVSFFMYTITCI